MEFGDLRMLCQEAPGSAAWRAIVATVEAKFALGGAHADEVEAVWLPYAEQALERWPAEHRDLTPQQRRRALSGEPTPTLKLVRRVYWTNSGSAAQLRKIVGHPDLGALSSLHLYGGNEQHWRALLDVRPELLAGLEELRVDWSLNEPGLHDALLDALAEGGKLRKLHLWQTRLSAWLGPWAPRAERLPVTDLQIEHNKERPADKADMALLEWLSCGAARRLERLTLASNALSGVTIRALLAACASLSSINLYASELPERDLLSALELLPLDALRELKVNMVGLSERDVGRLGALLRQMRALRKLQLQDLRYSEHEELTAPSLEALGELPAWLDEVYAFKLHPSQVFVPGSRPRVLSVYRLSEPRDKLARWLDALDLSCVEHLSWRQIPLHANDVATLAQLHMPALKRVSMGDSELDDEGMARLLEAPWASQMRTLELDRTRITDASADAMRAWLPDAAVRELWLDQNSERLTAGAMTSLMEVAIPRSAPLLLSFETRVTPHRSERLPPIRPGGEPWPPHVQFFEL